MEEGLIDNYDGFTIPVPKKVASLDLNRNFPAGIKTFEEVYRYLAGVVDVTIRPASFRGVWAVVEFLICFRFVLDIYAFIFKVGARRSMAAVIMRCRKWRHTRWWRQSQRDRTSVASTHIILREEVIYFRLRASCLSVYVTANK